MNTDIRRDPRDLCSSVVLDKDRERVTEANTMLRSLGAVLLGFAVTALVGVAAGAFVAVVFLQLGVTGGRESPERALAVTVAMVLATPIGGWTTARVSSRSPLIHALVLGIIIGFDGAFDPDFQMRTAIEALRFVAFVSAALLGGWIASRRHVEEPRLLPHDA
jgi:hypothetical protein